MNAKPTVVELRIHSDKSLREAADDIKRRADAGELRNLVIAWETKDGELCSTSVCEYRTTHIALCEIVKHSVL